MLATTQTSVEVTAPCYTQNIAWSSGDMSGVEAVNMWVSEQADYDYGSNTCASGKQCGHYTQIVPHNVARALVRVNPLRWDFDLATVAQDYANQLAAGPCSLEHSSGPYGENLAMGSGDMSAAQAVAMWIDEKSYYDYYSNSCHGSACGHYTQVVWRGSARLGCGKGMCANGASIIVCNYDPAGNYIGTKPY
ncbi:unnamed protein product [Brassica oleracea var. botrytis]